MASAGPELCAEGQNDHDLRPFADVQEAQQRFNDFCCAQKTFYSVETVRRQRSEEQTIRQILQGASPEKIQEIKELIKAEIERIAKSSQKNVQKNEVIQPVRTQSGMER